MSRVPQDDDGLSIADSPGDYEIEKIVSERTRKNTKITEYEVKWVGYDETTFEPLENVQDTKAFDNYKKKK